MTSWLVREGDCVESMRSMDEATFDAIVTDPPYGLGFMGKEWDHAAGPQSFVERKAAKRNTFDHVGGNHNPSNSADAARTRRVEGQRFQAWCEAWACEAFRVLKPGGHLLAFGGTRTYHRLAAGIEDAGFEIRDTIAWMYGSGFPKSLDVSKAIDKEAGADRQVVGYDAARARPNRTGKVMGDIEYDRSDNGATLTAPATPEAEQWEGWGTALKPSHEPVVVARKPFPGTVVANVLKNGVGALNVNGCRIGTSKDVPASPSNSDSQITYGTDGTGDGRLGSGFDADVGRWPANVVLDEEAGAMLDEQSGELVSGANPARRGSDKFRDTYGDFTGQEECEPPRGKDVGGASRFFYCAKTSRSERNAGLGAFAPKALNWSSGEQSPGTFQADRTAHNAHPTVKPIALMRWLCRLVTPPGGLILDPFVGSGSTGCAAAREGFAFVGLERDPEYAELARARIKWWAELPADLGDEEAALIDERRRARADAGQETLWA